MEGRALRRRAGMVGCIVVLAAAIVLPWSGEDAATTGAPEPNSTRIDPVGRH